MQIIYLNRETALELQSLENDNIQTTKCLFSGDVACNFLYGSSLLMSFFLGMLHFFQILKKWRF